MKRSSWIALGIICALAALLIYRVWPRAPRLTDEEQIHAVLEQVQSAVSRKDTGLALSCISQNYHDPDGNTFDSLRLLIIRGFRTAETYQVVFENTSIEVHGDKAVVQFDAHVNILYEGGGISEIFSAPMTLDLKKESGTRWLVIPVKVWKITSISNLPTGDLGD